MHYIFGAIRDFCDKWAHLPGMCDPEVPLDFGGKYKDTELAQMYIGFIREELKEIEDALENPDKKQRQIGVGDGLCDVMVFLVFMIVRLGYGGIFRALYREVSRSNLTKGVGQDLFDHTGKMIKGPEYTRPDFETMFWAPRVTFVSRETRTVKLLQLIPGLIVTGDRGRLVVASNDGIPPYHTLSNYFENVDQHLIPYEDTHSA